jgi:hypothetical protein
VRREGGAGNDSSRACRCALLALRRGLEMCLRALLNPEDLWRSGSLDLVGSTSSSGPAYIEVTSAFSKEVELLAIYSIAKAEYSHDSVEHVVM